MSNTESSTEQSLSKQILFYVLKAALLLLVLYGLKWSADTSQPFWVVSLFWLVLSLVSAAGIAYCYVVKKTYRQVKYQADGFFGKRNNGRVLCIIGSGLIGALLTLTLVFEIPSWGITEWVLVVSGVVLYFCIAFLASRRFSKEFKPLYRRAAVQSWSTVLTGIVLLVIFALALYFLQNVRFDSALQSFLSVHQPFKDSDSQLLSKLGELFALSDGLVRYAISETAIEYFVVALIWRVVAGAGSMFGIANLLGACSLPAAELKRIFLPLEDLTESEVVSKKRSFSLVGAVTAVIVTVFLFAVSLWANDSTNDLAGNKFVVAVENIVKTQVGESVCSVDGKYYDRQRVVECLAAFESRSEELRNNAAQDLTPSIESYFEKRKNGVGDFYSWFQSSWLERMANAPQGKLGELLNDQFETRIENVSDDTELLQKWSHYSEEAQKLKSNWKNELAGMELPEENDLYLERVSEITPAAVEAAFAPLDSFIQPITIEELHRHPDINEITLFDLGNPDASLPETFADSVDEDEKEILSRVQ